MKLSTKCRYGTRAMIEIARHYNEGPVKRKDISRSQKISSAYLENILIALKSQNLIRTVRGADGGFILANSPSSITMFQIVSALEGPIVPVECVDKSDACKQFDEIDFTGDMYSAEKLEILGMRAFAEESFICLPDHPLHGHDGKAQDPGIIQIKNTCSACIPKTESGCRANYDAPEELS